MKLIQFGLILLVFTAGFFAPDLLQWKKKMEFVQLPPDYRVIDCVLSGRKCQADDYELRLLDGNFLTLERTTFQLKHAQQVIRSDILITSDDNQFGTLLSQDIEQSDAHKDVLIPYCGNPIMHIIVVDKNRKTGLLVKESAER
ncbi:hypothetical protein L3Q72_07650 [Vibrio sp. JC009]|uniref:hypothetical protein n=1 Tax=Vibrio sp. JC009 TaxID=2912314 RepID=UPI0023B101BF|nr:hypothetical protein [Vibrio sp. JC009]WED20530.1 hypothetical protein L3Q72_07650 [Vibrio sp. JC009]